MASSPKIMKIEENWYKNCKLIKEKYIYLNKSSTKYIAYGIHPQSFEKVLILVDRATGNCIVLPVSHLDSIESAFKDIIYGNGEKANHFSEPSGISITPVNQDIWKFNSSSTHQFVFIHKTSLQKFSRLYNIIDFELSVLDAKAYFNKFEDLKTETEGMDESKILSYLENQIKSPDNIKRDIALYLVCNHDHLINFNIYNESFYRRVTK